MKVSRLNERASVHLDIARALAAMAVMVGHVRGLFFATYHDLPVHPFLIAVLYRVTSLGHQSVIVFFVLSGFFIVSSVASSLEAGRWSWTSYFVNRVTRLTIVLAPALILCSVVDRIGMASPSGAFLYHQPLLYFFSESAASRSTVRIFLGNLFYLQGITVPVFGSDGPLWSLSYEFWYYVLFPLGICALIKKFRPGVRVAYLLMGFAIAYFIGRTITLYFLIWLLGGGVALVASLGRPLLTFRGASAAALVALVAALGCSNQIPVPSVFLGDLGVALVFAIWMWATMAAQGKVPSALWTKTARGLAGFSYTLYLCHFPMLLALRAWLLGGRVWQPDVVHLGYGLTIAVTVTAATYVFAQVTEARTSAVRRSVMALLAMKERPPRVSEDFGKGGRSDLELKAPRTFGQPYGG